MLNSHNYSLHPQFNSEQFYLSSAVISRVLKIASYSFLPHSSPVRVLNIPFPNHTAEPFLPHPELKLNCPLPRRGSTISSYSDVNGWYKTIAQGVGFDMRQLWRKYFKKGWKVESHKSLTKGDVLGYLNIMTWPSISLTCLVIK